MLSVFFYAKKVKNMPASVYLEVDATDLNEKITRLQETMKPEKFYRAMYGIFKQTGGHVRKILKQDLPQQYNISSGEVGKAVENAKVTMGTGGGTGCVIPVVAARRNIGGGGKRGFTAYGHRRGWAAVRSGHYNITAQVYRSGRSTLPAHMSDYGGQPPFRNIPSKLGGLTFTREGKERLPIRPVMGISIPDMPLNRSEPDVQKDIKEYLENRIEHRLTALLLSGR